MPPSHEPRPAIRVRQWLPEWDKADFSGPGRRKPEPHFYVTSLPGPHLRRLCGIYRREAGPGQARALDQGIQRRHNADRSEEIHAYLHKGFPWSGLSATKQASGDYEDLVKPGWLPTGIVVNVLHPEDTRRGRAVHLNDAVRIEDHDAGSSMATFHYPDEFEAGSWEPRQVPPLEVIDGQHRLWAFDEENELEDFDLPVILFNGLDIGWQAYLFYTVNIKPKRINQSLAFDLYPLLRTADWLTRAEGHAVYKETRAQELVEVLWSFKESPWRDRIDMLGEHGRRMVSQAAWIRSLTSSMIKSFEGKGVTIGGLFGGDGPEGEPGLAWSRSQQAAFLVFAWQRLAEEVEASRADWAEAIRDDWQPDVGEPDPALSGQQTLLNTDQGVRGVLQVINDLTMIRFEDLQLSAWVMDNVSDEPTESAVDTAIEELRTLPLGTHLSELAKCLAGWDWRSSSAPSLRLDEQQAKMRFRGGSGYREIRLDLLRHVSSQCDEPLSGAASEVLSLIA